MLYFRRCFKKTVNYHKYFEKLASNFLEFQQAGLYSVSVKNIYPFELFICLSLLSEMRNDFLKCESEMDVFEIFGIFNSKTIFKLNFDEIFLAAEKIFLKYCIKKN